MLSEDYKDRLHVGLTIIGTKSCFTQEEVQDYFYKAGTEFRPCHKNCKRCTSMSNCQECGSYEDKAKKFYLTKNVPMPFCQETCLLGDNRYELPAGGIFECIQCAATTFYKEGSDPQSVMSAQELAYG